MWRIRETRYTRNYGGVAMELNIILNDKPVKGTVEADTMLIDFLRQQGCHSVKRGCESSNCGLCTVLLENKTVLSCSYPAIRAKGHKVYTLEGLQDRALEFGGFMADEGAEQCGFCAPGFIMNVLAMVDDLEDPSDEEILEYLAGNLCRCSGYEVQLRAIKKYLTFKKEENICE